MPRTFFFLFLSLTGGPGSREREFCRPGALSRRDSRGGEATAGLLQFCPGALAGGPSGRVQGSSRAVHWCAPLPRTGTGATEMFSAGMEGSSTLVMIMPEEPHHLTTKQNDRRRRSLVRARATLPRVEFPRRPARSPLARQVKIIIVGVVQAPCWKGPCRSHCL